ncbi:MAG: hypothetical protein ACR2J4_02300 [Deinococcus sp.]
MPDPRSGTRFAVYLCPPGEGDYYRLGSELLGYDVRARRELPLPDFIRPGWQIGAAPYGLHLTLVEGFYCDPASIGAIEAELRALVACLSPSLQLELSGGRVEVWEQGEVVIAHRFDPSPHLLMLHALLLGRLAPFATHSPFQDEQAEHPERYRQPWEAARLRLLGTPRGLDSFEPHFTLVQPYGGPDAEGLRSRLAALLDPFSQQEYRSVALFVKPEGEARWQLQAEVGIGG